MGEEVPGPAGGGGRGVGAAGVGGWLVVIMAFLPRVMDTPCSLGGLWEELNGPTGQPGHAPKMTHIIHPYVHLGTSVSQNIILKTSSYL